jgi:hypothetical protein
MAVPYTFGSATTSIPLSQLDSNFATTITLGNTAIQLGNTVTTLNNMTLANVTISSGTSNLATTAITNGTSNVTIASSGGNIAMATNGATAITVDTSQNVGIGTTSLNSSNSSRSLSLNGATDVAYELKSGGTFSGVLYHDGTTLTAKNVVNGAFAFGTNNTERMRIDSSGSLLLGTTTAPTTGGFYRSIASFKQLNDSGFTSGIQLEASGNTNVLGIGYNGDTFQFGQSYRSTGGYVGLSFNTSNSERVRITTGGYFKASSEGSYLTPASHHELRGAGANSYELVISNTNATPLSEYITDIRFTANTPNNGNARFLACTDPTNEKAAILSSGGFLSRNNSYGTYSDIKLKENIVNASPKLADVMRLQVRNFNFKTNPEAKQIGFIAQEFEQVFPAMVDESQDRAQDGTVLDETTKSIKTSVLVPILVKAIQELKAIVDAQATEIEALKAKVGA